RSKESEIFNSLIKEIPLSGEILTQLDKASVIRLAITHLKIRSFFLFGNKDVVCTFSSNELESKLNKLYYKAINGFIIVLTNAGSLVYVTENIKQHLGLSQIDMLGQNILDFIHPCDHDEIKDM
ncbi:hypothetical protein HELRODRAFT_135526, partial [Helobdella robusta]|uniref:PAS domain-containing protein n=1 Tax=Helobdella robusta TaxID=6412 RepID=T1EI93_HELRO